MVFEEMTRPEIEALPRHTLVVCPLGSTEQHGPHLPVGTDSLIVSALAAALERREPLLLAPVLRLGHSPHHLSFGGTLSQHHAHYAETLAQMARCFADMGFEQLLFLNGHGGNRLPVQMALQQLKLDRPGLLALGCEYWSLAGEALAALRESPLGGMGHACELETSLCLYLAPQLVRMDRIADGGRMSESPWFQSEMQLAAPVAAVADFAEITENGAFGMASLATAEKGGRFFGAIVDALARFVQALPPKGGPWPYSPTNKEEEQ